MFNSCLFLAYGTEAIVVAGYVASILSVVASAAGAVVSHKQQRDAARQTEMNAEAQQKALMAERQRKAAELAENQRRLAQQQRREQAAQFAALANTGFVATTGTPLEIMADTLEAQQRDMGDLTADGNLEQWRLGYQGQSLMQEARSSASLQRQQAGATLITGLANAASSAVSMSTPSANKGTNTLLSSGGSVNTTASKPVSIPRPAPDYRGSRSY